VKIHILSHSYALVVVSGLALAAVSLAEEQPRVAPERGHPPRAGAEASRGRGDPQETLMGRLLGNAEVAAHLGLSETQMETLKVSAREIRQLRDELRADMEKESLEQARMLTGETIDEDALMRTVERLGDVRTEMAKLRIRQLLVIRNTLNKEQAQKLYSMRQGRAKDMIRDRQKRFGSDRAPHPPTPANPAP